MVKMELEKLSFSDECFCDEVREGFFVSEMMKRFWAAQLVVLKEIHKICLKHDLKWFAFLGTLLGAVRHKGFVPWDDDIDIAMTRQDYERFMNYAVSELPKEYCVLFVRNNAEYDAEIGRITNGNSINMTKEHLEQFYGCPFVVGVDIFPIDKIYNDPKKEEDRKSRALSVISEIKSFPSDRHSEDSVRKLYCELEDILSECDDEDSKESAVMLVMVTENWTNCSSDVFKEWKNLPFENTYLRAPVKYHELLTAYYKDYMTVKKGGAGHGYPLYKEQEEILRQKTGRNTYRYTFSKDCFSPAMDRSTLMEEYIYALGQLQQNHETVNRLVNNGNMDDAQAILQLCQNTALLIGNGIEGKYGEGIVAVHWLEKYCEGLYEQSLNWDKESEEILDTLSAEVISKVRELFINSLKQILFLPCKGEWWSTMEPLFDLECMDKTNDVKVIPVPYYYSDYRGKLSEVHTDRDYFVGNEKVRDHLTNFDDYNLAQKHPDMIVVQVPYDGYSASFAIPKGLYTDNLKKYTDKLVYIPCFEPDPPDYEGDIVSASLLPLVEQPAVVNADSIIIRSSKLRDYYINVMTELVGADTRDYWESKICLM
jgi:phosphorylcholine metabolism protein LicD